MRAALIVVAALIALSAARKSFPPKPTEQPNPPRPAALQNFNQHDPAIPSTNEDPDFGKFQRFIETFNKSYRNLKEYEDRFGVFKTTLREIERWKDQQGPGPIKYQTNEFSDLTYNERESMTGVHGNNGNAALQVFSEKISSVPLNPMRAAKCVIPKGLAHATRAAMMQQCISNNYASGNETRCYGKELGCFPMDAPWTSLLRPLPSPIPPPEVSVKIYCYTRASSKEYYVELWPDISLNGCAFSPDKKSVFIVHGFASNGRTKWLPNLKDVYLEREDVNVFIVDWGQGAELMNYLQVASNTRIVGAEVARFVKYLVNEKGMTASNLHLIGHSLGSHISAYIAKRTNAQFNTKVDRISALDPAQPAFENESPEVRLYKEDAKFVDAIHTNGLPFLTHLGFGFMTSVGHVDIYMNGGLMQPGCQIPNEIPKISSIKDLAKFPVEVIGQWVCCSHCRATEYFTDAVRKGCNIWARAADPRSRVISAGTMGLGDPISSKVKRCNADNCLALGLETPLFKARGDFVASTPIFRPFCDDPRVSNKITGEIEQSAGGSLFAHLPGVGANSSNVFRPFGRGGRLF